MHDFFGELRDFKHISSTDMMSLRGNDCKQLNKFNGGLQMVTRRDLCKEPTLDNLDVYNVPFDLINNRLKQLKLWVGNPNQKLPDLNLGKYLKANCRPVPSDTEAGKLFCPFDPAPPIPSVSSIGVEGRVIRPIYRAFTYHDADYPLARELGMQL